MVAGEVARALTVMNQNLTKKKEDQDEGKETQVG